MRDIKTPTGLERLPRSTNSNVSVSDSIRCICHVPPYYGIMCHCATAAPPLSLSLSHAPSPSPSCASKSPCRDACSSLSRRSIARVWNPRFWKLAAPNGTAECESRALRSSIGEGYGFSTCIPLRPCARPRGLIFPFSKSTRRMP
jgi:hypothetical protein